MNVLERNGENSLSGIETADYEHQSVSAVESSEQVQSRRGKKDTRVQQEQVPVSTFYLIGTRVDNITGNKARQIISNYVSEKHNHRAYKVFFSNVHSICLAQKDWIMKRCINQADLILADGSGLKIGGFVTGHPIVENLNGTDFTPTILRLACDHQWSVYLLGGTKEVVERCYARIKLEFPGITIAGFHKGYFQQNEENDIAADINRLRPDIVLVALGSPLQEKWISRNAYKFHGGVFMGVGGFFDFFSKKVRRAPRWMRRAGIEWMYRFAIEPANKWERIIIEIPLFLMFLFAQWALPEGIRRRLHRMLFSYGHMS